MRVVEQILRADQERERRYQAALAAVAELEQGERERLLAELIRQAERVHGGNGKSAAEEKTKARPVQPSAAPPAPVGARKSFVALAEVYVADNPGCTTDEVSKAIGQALRPAYGTLRHLATSRGTVVSRDGKWWPTQPAATQKKTSTNRSAISTVLARGRALSTGQIYEAVLEILPEAQKGSIASEVNRMKHAGLLVERGTVGRGPGYALANGGSHASVS